MPSPCGCSYPLNPFAELGFGLVAVPRRMAWLVVPDGFKSDAIRP
jgi:hypothetical protein